MNTDTILSWFPFGSLVCWGLLGVSRAVIYHRRGVKVIVADRERSPREIIVDLLAAACLLGWSWEVIAFTFGLSIPVQLDGLSGGMNQGNIRSRGD